MNKDRELKPCPFCGGKAEDDYGWIFCSKCGVGYDYLDRGKGITDWNKRSYKPLGKEELLEIIKKEVFRQFYRRRYYLTPEEIFFSKLDLKDKVVYDIGAFIGLKTILFAKKAKQVIAFEPNYGTFAIMEENITLNNLDNVRTLSCGIGDKTDIKLLSFNPLFPGCGSMKIETKGKVVKTLTEVYSLDDCIKKFNLSIPDFIKIDIEGMEDEALEGMSETLKHKPALYIEVHGINKEDKDKHIMSIGRTLLTYNYTVDLVDAEGHIYCV